MPFHNDNQLIQDLKKTARKRSLFPYDRNYYDAFRQIDAYMNERAHPAVMLGAMAHDQTWLTDHGPDHIKTVMDRACDLVYKNKTTFTAGCILKPYELFLLLVAIHFHDIGNMDGRDDHERHITEHISALAHKDILLETFEARLIRDIAESHGGRIRGTNDKDTIRMLRQTTSVDSVEVRPQLLAGILRFADELADGRGRAARYALHHGGMIPYHNEAYHHYADRLSSVSVQDNTIRLGFELSTDVLTRTFGKGDSEAEAKPVYLVDEIYQRLFKMHIELMYCSRYFRPYIGVDQIDVNIEICSSNYMNVLDEIPFSLRDEGYPKKEDVGIYSILPQLITNSGEELSRKYGG